MQTLILSCNTGAGHNSCAQAVQEAYHSRGEICNITDSLQFISEKASTFISNWHTRIYRHAPRLFDAGYQRAEALLLLFKKNGLTGSAYCKDTALTQRNCRHILLRSIGNLFCKAFRAK